MYIALRIFLASFASVQSLPWDGGSNEFLSASAVQWYCTFGGFFPCIRCDGTDICAAAAMREPSAAIAPFQRIPPSHPPTQNVNSAAMRELPASHFGGSIAKFAQAAKIANQKT